MLKKMLILLFLFALGNAWAGPYDPIISRAWVGESVPGQTTASLQLNVTTVKAIKLISVSSTLADTIEIHSVSKHKGEMKPRVTAILNLPERSTIVFGSRGLFLMMTGIKQQLNTGDRVPVSMVFITSDKQTKTISAVAEVKKMELSYKHYGPNEVYDHR